MTAFIAPLVYTMVAADAPGATLRRASKHAANTPVHLFGGQATSLQFEVCPATGTDLQFRGQLFQVVNPTAAALGTPFSLSRRTDANAGCLITVTAKFDAPTVRSAVQLELRIESAPAGTEDWALLGSQSLTVHPRNMFDNFRTRRLIVDDRGGALRDFLLAEKIEYLNPTQPQPKNEVIAILVSSGKLGEDARLKSVAERLLDSRRVVILLREVESPNLKIVALPKFSGLLITAETGPLTTLSDDPLAQIRLKELLTLSLELLNGD